MTGEYERSSQPEAPATPASSGFDGREPWSAPPESNDPAPSPEAGLPRRQSPPASQLPREPWSSPPPSQPSPPVTSQPQSQPGPSAAPAPLSEPTPRADNALPSAGGPPPGSSSLPQAGPAPQAGRPPQAESPQAPPRPGPDHASTSGNDQHGFGAPYGTSGAAPTAAPGTPPSPPSPSGSPTPPPDDGDATLVIRLPQFLRKKKSDGEEDKPAVPPTHTKVRYALYAIGAVIVLGMIIGIVIMLGTSPGGGDEEPGSGESSTQQDDSGEE
ncbi:hypothetical protein [Haloglycomyces albus]|uniref:hypothetical protein n=1 Tax=Haloglycomyces albus TaxID=526067 RepID=UPI0004BACD44|nr:hypothetical protein [Haloglycomyces albus]